MSTSQEITQKIEATLGRLESTVDMELGAALDEERGDRPRHPGEDQLYTQLATSINQAVEDAHKLLMFLKS
jgi:hypothetical protein